MPIDFAYILAAGKGTRMGEIGKNLPKPLWPIFEKSLLELQVLWCISLGIKKVYINAHFLAEQVEEEARQLRIKYPVELNVLKEEPLLDSGGCIHNLAQQKEINYKGKLLLVNADQFYFFSNKYFADALELMEQNKTASVLFALKVSSEDNYNETVLSDNGKLLTIEKNSIKENYQTYSGLGVIDLSKLNPVQGISKFFESVADYKNQNVFFVCPDKAEYWDFGTSQLYVKNTKKILQVYNDKIDSDFIKFLIVNRALIKEKMDASQYQNFYENDGFDLEHKGRCQKGKIIFKDIIQDF